MGYLYGIPSERKLCSEVHFLSLSVGFGAVLTLDRELETALFHRLDAKRCAVCGALFTPGSNRAKYCPECAQMYGAGLVSGKLLLTDSTHILANARQRKNGKLSRFQTRLLSM